MVKYHIFLILFLGFQRKEIVIILESASNKRGELQGAVATPSMSSSERRAVAESYTKPFNFSNFSAFGV